MTNNPTFTIDPIDRTTNFVHSFPSVCISFGLTINKEPVVGVIFNPFHTEMYSTIKGEGAFLTRGTKRCRLPLSGEIAPPLAGLGQTLIGAEYGSDRDGNGFEIKVCMFGKARATGILYVILYLCVRCCDHATATDARRQVRSKGSLVLTMEMTCARVKDE